MILVFKSEAAQSTPGPARSTQKVGRTPLWESAQAELERLGLSFKLVQTTDTVLLIVLDDVTTLPTHLFSQIEGVDKVVRIKPQCSLVFSNGSPSVSVGSVQVGGKKPVVIAGPCSVESKNQILDLSRAVKAAGANMLRGGVFKPRSSPYDFQGLGTEALSYLSEARALTGLPVVSEVMSAQQVELVDGHVDVLQIGARNMYNYELLKEVGRTRYPILLKRAMSATLQEFLSAAEYIMLEGNMQVILCERGIRTFETHTRNTLDLSAVAALKAMTPLPVLVDPSHGTGRAELIKPMSRAAIACGADGLLIEVHANPARAFSDGEQAITPDTLRDIIIDANKIKDALSGTTAYAVPTLAQPTPV